MALVPGCDDWVEVQELPEQWEENGNYVNRQNIPDYLSDLNATQEFFDFTTPKREFASAIQDICGNYATGYFRSYDDELLAVFHLVHASASQRCEAFLKTIGKWEGTAP